MTTVLFWIGCLCLVLVIGSLIPIVNKVTNQIASELWKLLILMITTMYNYSVWVLKAIWGSHLDVLNQLLKKAQDIDPSSTKERKKE